MEDTDDSLRLLEISDVSGRFLTIWGRLREVSAVSGRYLTF